MSREAAARLTWYIAGLGAASVVVMWILGGHWAAGSAALGALVALGNWSLLRMIVDRVIGGSLRRQAGLTFMLLVEMGGLIALVFLLLRSGFVDVLPFTIGVSSLMAGSLLGSFVHVLTAPAVESER